MEWVFPDAQTLLHELPKSPINLPDKAYVHVVETAISSGADYINTFNLKDFPSIAHESKIMKLKSAF